MEVAGAEDGIRDTSVTGVQTCALPISSGNILYGNGASYLWRNCLLDTEILDLIHEHTTSLFCPSPDALGELDPATGRYSVHDIQGLGDEIGRASCRERG